MVTFQYGPDRARYRRVDSHDGQVTETLYIGTVEKITHHDGSREWKRYIGSGLLITQQVNGQGQVTGELADYPTGFGYSILVRDDKSDSRTAPLI